MQSGTHIVTPAIVTRIVVSTPKRKALIHAPNKGQSNPNYHSSPNQLFAPSERTKPRLTSLRADRERMARSRFGKPDRERKARRRIPTIASNRRHTKSHKHPHREH